MDGQTSGRTDRKEAGWRAADAGQRNDGPGTDGQTTDSGSHSTAPGAAKVSFGSVLPALGVRVGFV
jgi:hypothetical protein